MIVKWSGLPTGEIIDADFYDTSTSPETVIAAANGTMVEQDTFGVYELDVDAELDAFTLVRVRATVGGEWLGDAWIAPGTGTIEVSSEPSLIDLQSNFDAMAGAVLELWQNAGLDPANPITITPTSRSCAEFEIVISGDGITESILTRTP